MKKVLYIFLILFHYGCKNNESFDQSEYIITATDSVFLNKSYQFSFDYKDTLNDKFTKQLNIDTKLRYIITHYVVDTIVHKKEDIFRNINRDSVLSYDSNKISLKNINFKDEGVYYISVVIEDRIVTDSVFLKGVKNSEVSESFFIKKVIVIK